MQGPLEGVPHLLEADGLKFVPNVDDGQGLRIDLRGVPRRTRPDVDPLELLLELLPDADLGRIGRLSELEEEVEVADEVVGFGLGLVDCFSNCCLMPTSAG
jgi:hypothetical protein